MLSIGAALDSNKGHGPGFDFLRILFATTIVAWHVASLSGHGPLALSSPAWIIEYATLPMFFMLSGFLVAGSGMRLTLRTFIAARALRIYPALVVDIVVAAFILGPLLTTLPLSAYFTDAKFWAYFSSMLGWPQYYLPGLFQTNYSHQVNGALWTVPYEILCYVTFAGLMICGLQKSARFTLVLFLALALLPVALISVPYFPGRNLALEMFDPGMRSRMVPSFLMGVVFFQLRYRIPRSAAIFAACVVASIALPALMTHAQASDTAVLHTLMAPVLCYLVAFAGVTKLPKVPVLSRGDYSYGIYLYHAPLLQAVLLLTGGYFYGAAWPLLFVVGFPVVVGVAAISWHFVEKPILRLRKRLSLTSQPQLHDLGDATPRAEAAHMAAAK